VADRWDIAAGRETNGEWAWVRIGRTGLIWGGDIVEGGTDGQEWSNGHCAGVELNRGCFSGGDKSVTLHMVGRGKLACAGMRLFPGASGVRRQKRRQTSIMVLVNIKRSPSKKLKERGGGGESGEQEEVGVGREAIGWYSWGW